ncbi:MAG: hypothetical protein JWO44_436 [Bacteroidetes bacterium]|nr:hypothetical protein [Bacteroidota bacterium]
MLSIAFKHLMDGQVLQLDSAVYKNAMGQPFTVSNFKYYISNIQLVKADGKEIAVPGYFLINEDEEASKQLMFNSIPAGEYVSLHFIIGVDSLHNCSGAQSGALDPAKGMFWAWNSGYIFLKLEGKAAASASPGKIFEYHIGGYKAPANCIRKVNLRFEKNLHIEQKNTAYLTIKVNAAEVLRSPASIDFSTLSSVTGFHNASMIADNYTDMFSIAKPDEK